MNYHDRKDGETSIGGFQDGYLKKERKSVRGQGIIVTRRGDRPDARDWTRNIIVFGYLPREKIGGGRAEATQWRKGASYREKGLPCGLKGFEVGGWADLREPGSQGTPSIASSRNYTFERSYYLR